MTLKFQIKPFTKPPRRLVKTPRLTVEQMVRKSTKNSIGKSKNVRILTMKTMRKPKALPEGWITYRLRTINMENGHQYNITIFSPTTRITPTTKLMIDSSVAAFVFQYEYALAKRGNAFIYRSNGAAPSTTNPRMIPGLDHHSIAALKHLIKNTKKAAETARSRGKPAPEAKKPVSSKPSV